MDKNKMKKLNGYHVVFLVQNSMASLVFLSLPNKLSSMGYNQWWVPLLFGVTANIMLIPMIWLLLQYKKDNLFIIHKKLLGQWLGTFVNLFYILYSIFITSSIIKGYLDLVEVVVLPDKTTTGPLIIFLLLLIYIIHGGIKSIARFCIMSFFLTIPFLYALQWGFAEGDLSHLLPIYNFTFKEFVIAQKEGFISMTAFSLILFSLHYPTTKSIQTCIFRNLDNVNYVPAIYDCFRELFFRMAAGKRFIPGFEFVSIGAIVIF